MIFGIYHSNVVFSLYEMLQKFYASRSQSTLVRDVWRTVTSRPWANEHTASVISDLWISTMRSGLKPALYNELSQDTGCRTQHIYFEL
jgi:hypothetical protein